MTRCSLRVGVDSPFAVDEVEVSVAVELADVAGVKPQVGGQRGRCVGAVPVPVEHDVRALGPYDNLAGFAGGKFIVVLVEDADIEVLVGSPG